MTDLAGQVAIVTGAASGQGASASRLFAKAGARVVLADRDGDGADALATELTSAGAEAAAFRVDVSRDQQVAEMVSFTVDRFGRLDILFNNAGIGFSEGSRLRMAGVVDTPEADWDEIVAINLKGVALGCKHALPVMAEQGSGAIVNNASVNGLIGLPGADAYTAAKGGVVALTRALAVEWAPRGVRVNCICPGSVATPMIGELLERPEFADYLRRRVPMRRWAEPEEIARVAVFLASPAASYINGAVIPVDGGWTAQ